MHGAFAGRVTAPLGIGGILQSRQYVAIFAVFGECMQVEQTIVGWCGINLEIASMDDHAQRRMDPPGPRNPPGYALLEWD